MIINFNGKGLTEGLVAQVEIDVPASELQAIADMLLERCHALELGWTPKHDDEQTMDSCLSLIYQYLSACVGVEEEDPLLAELLAQVAGLAIAALAKVHRANE